MEGILGFFVSFVYLSGFDANREDKSFGPGLAYGFATAAGHLLAVHMNSTLIHLHSYRLIILIIYTFKHCKLL